MMLAPLFLIVSLFSLPVNGDKKTTEDYIASYKDEAMRNMQLSGVPASITLAQGILESGSGNSALAKEANNHFGIKCHKGWEGETYIMDDDEKNECFRKYENVLASYRDHALFLTSRERYRGLFDLEPTNYRGWAEGLKAAGYATNPNYAPLLIGLIERYELHQFDSLALGIHSSQLVTKPEAEPTPSMVSAPAFPAEPLVDEKRERKPAKVKPTRQTVLLPKEKEMVDDLQTNQAEQVKSETVVSKSSVGVKPVGTFYVNGLKVVYLQTGENLATIARNYEVSLKQIKRYNDISGSADITPGELVFLEPKRNAAAKGTYTHVVIEGDSWLQISQQYGVALKWLLKRNSATIHTPLQVGATLLLRKDLQQQLGF
jgi:hypothetical protein